MNLNAASQEDALADLMASLEDPGEILLSGIEEELSTPVAKTPEAELLAAIDVAAEPAISGAGAQAGPSPASISKVEAAAPAKPERKAPVRKHYASKVDRLQDKIGADLGDYTVLEVADGALEGDSLAAKQAETIKAIEESGVKVQNRITFILEFMAGKSAKLNGVISTAFRLLKSDGAITTGDAGNLQVALVKDGKTMASARSMTNNTIAAMRALKVMDKDPSGKYVANPQSLVLMKLNSMLAL